MLFSKKNKKRLSGNLLIVMGFDQLYWTKLILHT